jgi:hypothetical protein
MEVQKANELFVALIYSLQMQSMMNLGKLKNPATDKIEKNLEGAQVSIEMLEMLSEKTKNNISEEISRVLQTIISDLRLNYVEESQKE